MFRKGLLITIRSLIILFLAPAIAHSQVAPIATWNGGTGNWEDPTQWTGTPGIYPNDDGTNYYAATVSAGSAIINSSIAVNSLNLANASVDVAPGASLTVEVAPVTYNGESLPGYGGNLNINNGGQLQVDGNAAVQGDFNLNGSLTGSGTLTVGGMGITDALGGQFNWTSGQITGQGTLISENIATWTFDTSAGPLYFGGWTVSTGGFMTLVCTGSNDLIDTGGGTFDVNQGALALDGDQNIGVPASPGVAPISIELDNGRIVKDSPGITHLQDVVVSVVNQRFVPDADILVSQGTLIMDNPLSIPQAQVDGTLQTPSLTATTIAGRGTIQAEVSADSVRLLDQTTGTLHIVGDLTLNPVNVLTFPLQNNSATSVALDIMGPGSGQHDLLEIDGAFSITPGQYPLVFNIALFFANYLPQAGDTFDLITYGSLGNIVDPTVLYSGLAPGFEFSISPTPNALVFTALNDAQPLPEPTCALLMLAPLFFTRRVISRPVLPASAGGFH